MCASVPRVGDSGSCAPLCRGSGTRGHLRRCAAVAVPRVGGSGRKVFGYIRVFRGSGRKVCWMLANMLAAPQVTH